MLVSINQPAYLPWLGYFDRIQKSDLHIVLDHVQFEKNSFTNRNKIRTAQGWSWLTVPLKTKGQFGDLAINTLEIADPSFARKHWNALKQSYSKAPHFKQHAPFFEALYAKEWQELMPLMEELVRYQLNALRITTPLVYSSTLGITSKKDQLVLDLCQKVGAKTYLSGPLGKNYLNTQDFVDAGIALRYHEYEHPTYPQVYEGFEPFMAAVDWLFNTRVQSSEFGVQ